MRSDCFSCHKIKEDFTSDLCANCQNRQSSIKAEIAKAQPEATPDQVLYLTRQAMQAGGWHPKSEWTDPRAFTRRSPNSPA